MLIKKLETTILLVFGYFNFVTCQFELEEYYKMPPMHREEDYERCLFASKEPSIYCTISTLIKPDKTNAVWNQVEAFSSKIKVRFAHDVIFSGQCLSKCQKRLNELSEKERENLYVEEFPTNRTYTYDITAYKNGTLYRKLYDKMFNQCENIWLRENWNLSAYSTILWCTTNEEYDHYETDFLYTSFTVITFIILGIVIAGTSFDLKQNKENNLNYYKVTRHDLPKNQQYLLCFSLMRNWYRLVAPPKSKTGRDLRFILTIRYLTTLMIIMGHVFISYSFTPSMNPEFVEISYDRFEQIFFNHGQSIVQTFFVASGLLLYLSFNEVLKEGQLNSNYFGISIIYRYIRLTPPYAYVLLFHSTYLFHCGYGAYWKFFGETEYTYCRRNWWTNLLYINNYVNANQQCMITSWYLAADTHLFLFALFLFMIMWKYPKYKKLTIGLAFFISCTIQFLVSYLNGLDGTFLLTPEVKRFITDNHNMDFEKDYIASHTNSGNFLIGVFLAMMYLHFKKNKIDLYKYKSFIALWHLTPPIGFLLISGIGYIFMHNDFELPSVWISLVSVITRQIWGIFAIIMVLGFISSFRSPIKNFFNWPVFTPLSRLTYCIYLSHATIARIIFAREVHSIYFTWWLALTQFISLTVVSNFMALILCLCIEFPLTGLTKTLFRKERAAMDKELWRIQNEHNNNARELQKISP